MSTLACIIIPIMSLFGIISACLGCIGHCVGRVYPSKRPFSAWRRVQICDLCPETGLCFPVAGDRMLGPRSPGQRRRPHGGGPMPAPHEVPRTPRQNKCAPCKTVFSISHCKNQVYPYSLKASRFAQSIITFSFLLFIKNRNPVISRCFTFFPNVTHFDIFPLYKSLDQIIVLIFYF